jgi:hypothetical protein
MIFRPRAVAANDCDRIRFHSVRQIIFHAGRFGKHEILQRRGH